MHGWVVLFLWRLTLPVLVFCLVGLCISKWELYTTVAISNLQRILLNIFTTDFGLLYGKLNCSQWLTFNSIINIVIIVSVLEVEVVCTLGDILYAV